MNVFPLGNKTLQGQFFNIEAKVENQTNGYQLSGLCSLVTVTPAELEAKLGEDFDPNTLVEDRIAQDIHMSRSYIMPCVDARLGADELAWYGNTHALRALRDAKLLANEVAFVATQIAISVLRVDNAFVVWIRNSSKQSSTRSLGCSEGFFKTFKRGGRTSFNFFYDELR